MNTSNAEASVSPQSRMFEIGAAVVKNFYARYEKEKVDPLDAEIAALINKTVEKELETQALLENIFEWAGGKNLLPSESMAFIKPNLYNLGVLLDTAIAESEQAVVFATVIDCIDSLPIPEEIKVTIIMPIINAVESTKPSEEINVVDKKEDGVAKVTVSRKRSNNR